MSVCPKTIWKGRWEKVTVNKYKKLFANTVMMTVGQFSSKILAFLLIPLYTSILTTEEYGVYDIIITTVTLLTPFFTLVISESILRFAIDQEYDDKSVFTIGMLTVFGGSGLVLALSPLFNLISTISRYSIWIAVFFFAINLHTVLLQFLKGINKVVQYSVMGVISSVVTLGLNIYFLVIRNDGITGYLLAGTIAHLSVSVLIIFINQLWRFLVNPFSIPRATYKDMLRYSVPMIPNSISWWISDSSDKYVILWFMTSSAVGLYSVAYKIPTLMTTVMSLFVSAFQISIFDEYKKSEGKSFFFNIYSSVAALLLLVASVLIFASKYLAVVLYQKDFYDAWMVGCILIFAFVFNSLSSLLGTLYTAAKTTKVLFYSTIIAAALNVLLNILLIPKFELYGAAFATLVSYICVWLIRGFLSKGQLDGRFMDALTVLTMLLIAGQIFIELSSVPCKTYISLAVVLAVTLITFIRMKNSFVYKELKNIIKRGK